MEDNVNFLHKISRPPKEFDAQKFIREIIATDIQSLMNKSYQGQFHEHVKKSGYPIEESVLRGTSYIPRTNLERSLRNAVEKFENIVLPGCEGSGKSTLIHRVFGDKRTQENLKPIYIDLSDVEGEKSSKNHDTVYTKIRNSLLLNIDEGSKSQFANWVAERSKNILTASFFDSKSPKSFVESFFIFLRTQKPEIRYYVILDNIDAITLDAAKIVFVAIKSVQDTVRTICYSHSELNDSENTRFVVSCRTPTYRHISGPSLGLFLDFPHTIIEVDDGFNSDLDVLDLMQKYCVLESAYIFGARANSPLYIGILGGSFQATIVEYIDIVCGWLARNKEIFNATIKKFSGRSIRRAKLYAAKVLSNPFIARLALFEHFKVVDIVRHEPNYLKRRLEEALFDFHSINSATTGFYSIPLNPFRVIEQKEDYLANPLLGLYCIDYLVRNCNDIASNEIFFANTIDVRRLVENLRLIGYSDNSVRDFFSSCTSSGLLRPVRSSRRIIGSADEFRTVFSEYVIDKVSRNGYWSLIFFKSPKSSSIFYNSALKSYYHVNSDHMIDNLEYELFCLLLSMKSLVYREKKLQELKANSEVLFESFTSRIRNQVFAHISDIRSNIFDSSRHGQSQSKARFPYQNELVTRLDDLYHSVKAEFLAQPGMI